MTRLNAGALPVLKDPVSVPGYPLGQRRIGIVHCGVGGFHRAHQAMYLDAL
ncbi:MAG: mannitol dehydrogenase family protein, partial [Micrococcaceae bacterium]|nr:mannitol dehydrogenase family protein [Micrococcaceae bacterium]